MNRKGNRGLIPSRLLQRIETGQAVVLLDNGESPRLVAYPETSETLWTLDDSSASEALRTTHALLVEHGYSRVVASNDAHCHICGQIVSSAHRHDCSTCGCGNITVDGGHDYAARCWMSDRYDDLAVYGWVRREVRRDTISLLSANRQTPQAKQLARVENAATRLFEITGIERGSGTTVKDAFETRSPFEAARAARREHEELHVERVRDLSLPPCLLDLLDEIGLGSVTAEACLAEDVAEWAEITADLLDSVHAEDARSLLASYLASKIRLTA